jgi:hypothetical protein
LKWHQHHALCQQSYGDGVAATAHTVHTDDATLVSVSLRHSVPTVLASSCQADLRAMADAQHISDAFTEPAAYTVNICTSAMLLADPLAADCRRCLSCGIPQVPELDVIVVPVSGGGMLSGITLAAKALKPSILVMAAEPCGSNDAADVAASKHAGQLVTDLPKPITIADGLQGERRDGVRPFSSCEL